MREITPLSFFSPIASRSAVPRRGGRVILLERLGWETLLLWLLHVVEAALGVADVTYTERDVEYELTL